MLIILILTMASASGVLTNQYYQQAESIEIVFSDAYFDDFTPFSLNAGPIEADDYFCYTKWLAMDIYVKLSTTNSMESGGLGYDTRDHQSDHSDFDMVREIYCGMPEYGANRQVIDLKDGFTLNFNDLEEANHDNKVREVFYDDFLDNPNWYDDHMY